MVSGQGGKSGGADFAVAFDAKIEPFGCLYRSNCGDVAIINRLLKTAFGGAALEPRTAPARDRLVRHIGVDVDTRHQSAAKAKAAGHRVVMDLVLRRLCGVEGFDAIGVERRSGHGSNSSLRTQACTAADPPQSFPSALTLW